MNKKKTLLLLGLAVCLFVMAAAALFLFRDAIASIDYKAWLDAIASLGPAPYFAAMTILPALWFPVSPFLVLAGAIYSLEVAIAGSICALTINIIISWIVSGKWLRPLFERLVGRFGYSIPDFRDKDTSSIIPIALLLRLTPGMPFPLQNYVLGVARMPFGPYLLVSVPIISSLGSCIILFGDALLKGDVAVALLAVCLLLLLMVVVRTLRNRLKARKLEAELS